MLVQKWDRRFGLLVSCFRHLDLRRMKWVSSLLCYLTRNFIICSAHFVFLPQWSQRMSRACGYDRKFKECIQYIFFSIAGFDVSDALLLYFITIRIMISCICFCNHRIKKFRKCGGCRELHGQTLSLLRNLIFMQEEPCKDEAWCIFSD
jgi:hypothetical protein